MQESLIMNDSTTFFLCLSLNWVLIYNSFRNFEMSYFLQFIWCSLLQFCLHSTLFLLKQVFFNHSFAFGVLELFITKLREPPHTYVKFLSCRSCWIGAIMGWGMSYIYASSFIAPHVLTCLQILSYDASFTILKIMKKKTLFLICLLNI